MSDCFIVRRGGANSAAGKFPEFTYSGTYKLVDDGKVDGVQNWRIRFLSSGTLRFNKDVVLTDVFMVGGGAGGGQSDLFTGGGGGGGYTKMVGGLSLEKNTDYEIVIGAGGNQFTNGGKTSAFGYSANGGYKSPGNRAGGNGGSGGGGGGNSADNSGNTAKGGSNGSNGYAGKSGAAGTGQGTTTYEFGDSTLDLYAGGGGGCGGAGGAGGGGRGQSIVDSYSGQNGTTNTGGGGGGSHSAGFKGGSGIVILRNNRGAS